MLRIANAILDLSLSPNALKVYVYLLACANRENSAIVRVCRIAERCHICENTVRTAITELEQMGMVKKQNRYNRQHQYIANAYHINAVGGRWFAFDTTNNPFALSGSTFKVFVFLLRCRGKNGKAFPSLRRIENAIGVCRSVVVKAIKQLETLGLVAKKALRAGKHNLYVVVRSLLIVAETKNEGATRTLHPQTQNKKHDQNTSCNAILSLINKCVKGVANKMRSFCNQVVCFLRNSTLTHPLRYKRKERL